MLRRFDGSVDFNRSWVDYKEGFGSPSGELWIGNEYLHQLTHHRAYTLRVKVRDWTLETRYAAYSSFAVDSEDEKYRLYLGDYTGGTASGNQAADLEKGFLFHNNTMFSTYDQANDLSTLEPCIPLHGYGGFWYADCAMIGPTNPYSPNDCNCKDSIKWVAWHGGRYSLKKFVITIRPIETD